MRCNICGSTEFGPGPGKRLSATGRLPLCLACGSLERHRTLRQVYERLREKLHFNEMDAIQFSDDVSVPRDSFKSFVVSIYGGENSLDIQSIDLPDGRYDLVACNHVLEHVADDAAALRELVRILGPDGILQLGVPDPVRKRDTDDWGEPRAEDHGHYRIYGWDFFEQLRKRLADEYLASVRWCDPVTFVEDVYFFVTRSRAHAEAVASAFPGGAVEALRGDGLSHPLGRNGAPLRSFTSQVLQGGTFRGRESYRAYVVERGHTQVEGWLLDGALNTTSLLACVQEELGVSGGICEIGVHHGRLFIALATMVGTDGPLIAIDVFENQAANVDKSGLGARTRFSESLKFWLGDDSRVTMLATDSLALSPDSIRALAGGAGVRLFSVDGGHTVQHVQNDIAIAQRVLTEGGLAIVNDFNNPHWPGVTEGIFRYLFSNDPEHLIPFCYGDNKLYFCQRPFADVYYAGVEQGLVPFAVDAKPVELCGHPVLNVRMPALADLLRDHAPVERPLRHLGETPVSEFTGTWHQPEPGGRWTGGARGGILLAPLVVENQQSMTLQLSGIATAAHPSTRLSVVVNGVERGTGVVHQVRAILDLSVDLPASVGPVHVEFVTDFAACPATLGLSEDRRTLGVFVATCEVH